jgi:uncharacterized repeat protein (TIGR02543 family)
MTKAVELGLLDDMSSPAGADGALRGNVAILLWNTLTAHMWVIESENAKDGVTYEESEESMLNIKFPDYEYLEEARVIDMDVDDGKVMITLDLDGDEEKDDDDDDNLEAELVKGDFLNLFGKEVTALYDVEEEEFLSITPTDNNKIVEGKIDDLLLDDEEIDGVEIADKDYSFDGVKGGFGFAGPYFYYAMLVMDGRDVEYATLYGITGSIQVEKVKETTDGVRVYAEAGTNMDIDEEAVVLIDGEWATVEDIEAGSIITELIPDELFAVSTKTVTGTFEKVEEEGSDIVMTVDDEEYSVSEDAMYYIDDDEEGSFISKFDAEDMEDEEVSLKLDYMGVVTRVDSGDVESANGDFYVTTSKGVWEVADSDGTVEYIKLIGANGEEESYTISEDAKTGDVDYDIEEKGVAVYAEFEDGEITVLKTVTEANDPFGEDDEFTVAQIDGLDEVDDNYLVEGSDRYKVNSSTVVYTVVTEEDDGDFKFVRVDVTEGIDALDDAEEQDITLVYDSTFKTVKFAFIGDEGTTGLAFGKVERVFTRNGEKYVELVDAEGDSTEVEYTGTAPVVDTVLVYKVVSDKLSIKQTLTPTTAGLYTSMLVDDVDGSDIRLLSPSVVLMDLEDEDYEDYRVVLVNMNELDVAGTYEIDDIAELDIEGLSLDEEDRLFVDNTNKVFAVFRGIDTDDTLTDYTLTYNLAGGTAGVPTNRSTYTVETANFTLSNPTRTGYTFAGWTGTGLTEATTTVTVAHGSVGNRTYTATWSTVGYSITYSGGDEVDFMGLLDPEEFPTSYTTETATFVIGDPGDVEGYDFAGWTGTGLTEPSMTVSIPLGSTGNRTYTATWTTVPYQISYILDGGTAGTPANPASYSVETADFTLTNPTKEGYDFAGWTGADLEEATTTVTIEQGSTGHRVYTATWTPTTYTLNYILDGGTFALPGNPMSYTIESSDITLLNPTRGTDTFGGWNGTDLELPTMSVTIPQGSIGDRTYTAIWITD